MVILVLNTLFCTGCLAGFIPIAGNVDQLFPAEVIDVKMNANPGGFNIHVTIKSPDTGCQQYADWWEIIDEEGNLLYRRILQHSHVNEQPFTRSGEGVRLPGKTKMIVRVHMNNTGYSDKGMKGTIESGFEAFTIPVNYMIHLEKQEPLPKDCAY